MTKQVTTFFQRAALLLAAAMFSGCADMSGRKSQSAGATQAPAPAATAVEQASVSTGLAVDTAESPPPAGAAESIVETESAPPSAEVPAAPAAAPSGVADSPAVVADGMQYQQMVDRLCEQIGNKLGSVEIEDCLQQNFVFGGGLSVNRRPLVVRDFHPQPGIDDDFRVLIMGGVHGDEYSSISILFKWLALFEPRNLEGEFHWRFAPLVNPDGLLDGNQAKRQNANGVDLNRNFPSLDWNDTAAIYWQESTGSNPRRFPGTSAASEPEVQWVVRQIEEFQPDVIVSVHAPYHLLDFDGPAQAPEKIGELYLHQLGVYPGSLGNFAGLNRRIPVVTLELPSAGIMPPADQISLMWRDLVVWLDTEGRKGLQQEAANRPASLKVPPG